MNVNGKTTLIGLIGWPVSHSLSPPMHNAALEALDLNWVYVPMPVRPQDLGQALEGLPALGFRGVNVTVPHKQGVLPFLDDIEEAAVAIGAVNTITIDRQNGVNNDQCLLRGTNTDWSGFLADLAEQDVSLQQRDCLVLGAGGSARAIVYGLLKAGARVTILARRPQQADQLAQDFQKYGPVQGASLADLSMAAGKSSAPLIVNTTPLGMVPHVDQSVWPDGLPFPEGAFAFDLVYNPGETVFIRQAQASGCRSSNGLGMLVHQGAYSFETWTQQKPDTDIMRRSLVQALQTFE